MERREDLKSFSTTNDGAGRRTTKSPSLDLLYIYKTDDGANLEVEDEEDACEQNLIFPDHPITTVRMSAGLETASALGLAYRFGLDSPARNLYLWPAHPTTTDPLFWHARGSHIHILFARNADDDFLPDRAIMTFRHVDDIGTSQPLDGRPLGGAFHFALEPGVERARGRVSDMFFEARWFWTNRRDGAGAAWRALGEGEGEKYLEDWDGLLQAFGRACRAWAGGER